MTKQSKNPDDRENSLVKSDSPKPNEITDANDGDLSDDDRARIDNAMAFIDAVKQTPDNATDSETARFNLHETVNSDEVIEGADRAVGSAKTIGRFEIIRMLGQGGFASVFLANDPKLNRKVAIKVLKPTSFFSSDASNRFDREAQAAAVLNHPNIIPVFECGAIDLDRYIVSAFSDGITLRQWSESQTDAVPVRRAAKIVAVLADAVEHAHQRGIVHRDLKPANILIETTQSTTTADGDVANGLPGLIRITDFGLAKYADSVDQLETADGAIVGTPAYMSPEQAKGEGDISTSSDIYSLGVILYELLTGQLPILGKTHIDTLMAISTADPKPLRRLNSEVPRDLEAICLKCLNKSPAQRYATSHELGEDLNRWLSGDVVLARRVTTTERLAKWCKRNPAIAIAFVAMFAALMVAIFQWRVATEETKRASLESVRADKNLARTQDLIDDLVNEVANNKDLPPSMRRGFTQKAVDLQVSILADAPDDRRVIVQTANAYRRLAKLLAEFGEPELALESINQSLATIQPLANDEEFSAMKMAILRYKSGILRILDRSEEAIEEVENSADTNDRSFYDQANVHFQQGMNIAASGNDEDAITEYEQALTMYAAMDSDPKLDVDIARLNFHCACSEMELKKFDKAKPRLQASLVTFESFLKKMPHHGQESLLMDVARCHLQLARISHGQIAGADFSDDDKSELAAEARESYLLAAENYQKLIGINPMIHSTWGQLAFVHERQALLESGLKNFAAAENALETFGTFFQSTPKEIRHYRDISVALTRSRYNISQAMIDDDEMESAFKQLSIAKTELDELLEKYAGDEELEMIRGKCEEALADYED